jgi:hypothetical protein
MTRATVRSGDHQGAKRVNTIRLDRRTTAFAKGLQHHLKTRANLQFIALNRSIVGYLKERAEGIAEGRLRLPFISDRKQAARADTRFFRARSSAGNPSPMPPPSPCMAFNSYAPFPSGFPVPPGATIPDPTYPSSSLGYAVADPATGALEVLAVTYNDDPTSMRSGAPGSVLVSKQMATQMTAAIQTISPNWSSGIVNVAASVQVAGYIISFPRGDARPTGSAAAWLRLRLAGAVASKNEYVEDVAIPACHICSPPFAPYDPIFAPFRQTVALGVQLKVSPGDLVSVAVSAEMYVSVSADSNLWMAGNFSHLGNSWWSPPASMQLLGVTGTC